MQKIKDIDVFLGYWDQRSLESDWTKATFPDIGLAQVKQSIVTPFMLGYLQ